MPLRARAVLPGAAHIYGIIPLFYSERSIIEMFTMSEKWLNNKKGEDIFLEKYDRKAFDAPSVAVDLVVLNKEHTKILLINRADHPFVNRLALPGGFYKPNDDTLELDGALVRPIANSDALYAKWVELSSLEKDKMAFDHYDIIQYVLRKK